MIAPQTGAHLPAGAELSAGPGGDVPVQVRSNRSGVLAARGLALALAGCARADVFDTSERWFSRPFDFSGRNAGYTYSELQDTNASRGPVGANDIVDASGACPAAPAPMAAAAPASAESQGVMPAPAGAAEPSLLGGAIALGMSECEVVYRAGAPANVQIGTNPNGARSVVLTYNGGPRPGIYHFEAGRLMDMDRVEVAAPKAAPKAKKKPKVAEKKKLQPQHVSTE
jgi:hypothetical protein